MNAKQDGRCPSMSPYCPLLLKIFHLHGSLKQLGPILSAVNPKEGGENLLLLK